MGRENGLVFGIFSLYNGAGYLHIKCSEYSLNNSQSFPQYRGRLPVHAQELLHSDLSAIGRELGGLGHLWVAHLLGHLWVRWENWATYGKKWDVGWYKVRHIGSSYMIQPSVFIELDVNLVVLGLS